MVQDLDELTDLAHRPRPIVNLTIQRQDRRYARDFIDASEISAQKLARCNCRVSRANWELCALLVI
jgi:hypothetical protein